MVDVKKDVVFNLGVKGVQQSANKMGFLAGNLTKVATSAGAVGISLAAAGTAAILAGKKFVEMSNHSQKFMHMVNNLNVSMASFDKQTGGLVDTFESFQAAMEMQNAEIPISEKQWAALGAAAAKFAQDAGEGPEGATTRMNQLTKAVIQGRETALIPYIGELSQTADKSAAAAEALAKLEEKFGNVTVKAQTAEEAYAAFMNNVGTVTDYEMSRISRSFNEWTVELLTNTDTLNNWASDLTETKGQLSEYYSILTDGDVIQAAHNETVQEYIDKGWDTYYIQGKLIQQGEYLSEEVINQAKSYIELKKNIEEAAEAERFLQVMQADKKARAVKGTNDEKMMQLFDQLRNTGSASEINAIVKQMLTILPNSSGVYSELDIMDAAGRATVRADKNRQIVASVGGGGGRGFKSHFSLISPRISSNRL